jgi:HK97 family phage portal protein
MRMIDWARGIFSSRSKSEGGAPAPIGFGYSGSSFLSSMEIEKNVTAVACRNVISNSIAILPLNLYYRDPKTGARKKAAWHSLYSLLRRKPNPSESPTQFIEKLVRHIVDKGNAYIYKVQKSGSTVALYLLNPEYVEEKYDWPNVSYLYQGKEYFDSQILHIPSLITDDYGKGKSLADIARAAVTLGVKLDQASLGAFGNGINSSVFVDLTERLKDIEDDNKKIKVVQEYADYLARNHAGPENAGKPYIGVWGEKITELKEQHSNRDAELLDSRKWQELEICKAYGVPPWIINGTYDVKYGGLEQGMAIYLNFCLAPYLRHIEQKFNTLLSPVEQNVYYFEFDYNVLLRPDEKSRGDFYTKLFNLGSISPAEICARENIDPPSEGGDSRFVPANMMPLRNDVLEAYMAGAKLKAQELGAGGGLKQPADPARAAGDDKA